MELTSKPAVSEVMRIVGRPRSEQARLAILSKAYEMLLHQPVSVINVVQIAKEAGVSTATVYRWWSNKEALLLEAFIEQMEKWVSMPTSGSAIERLEQRHAHIGGLFRGKHGVVVARLLAAIQDDKILRDELLKRVQLPQSKEDFGLVQEAIDAGELPEDTRIQFFLDMIYGPLVCRLLLKSEPITKEFVHSTFQYALAGAQIMYQRKMSRSR